MNSKPLNDYTRADLERLGHEQAVLLSNDRVVERICARLASRIPEGDTTTIVDQVWTETEITDTLYELIREDTAKLPAEPLRRLAALSEGRLNLTDGPNPPIRQEGGWTHYR